MVDRGLDNVPAVRPAGGGLRRWLEAFADWRLGRIADPAFQAWAARFPLTRPLVRRNAAELYDLVAGFVYSQTLFACVDLGILRALRSGPRSLGALAAEAGLPEDRMARLLAAAAALELVAERRGGRWALARHGAASLGVPGLEEMIRHHVHFYRDMADPAALLRGEAETELSAYWAYVSGTPDLPAETAGRYSRLMAASQANVAAETLAVAPLGRVSHMMDVGGGEGAFLKAALAHYPRLRGSVFDLPAVAARAVTRFAEAGLADRARAYGGSFRDGVLPRGADAISLVRVLYDHSDETVRALLAAVHEALPPGGTVVVSEPMAGGARPTRPGDAYFGFYTMAMLTGQPRSPERHRALLTEAGFAKVRHHRTHQPHITEVLSARRG